MEHSNSSKNNMGSVRNNNGSRSSTSKGKVGGGMMKLSTDPQSVAARERRHRISNRFKILQSLIPGGGSNKMDTVSMLDEAIHYVKFLKAQIRLHQALINFEIEYEDDHHPIIPGEPYAYNHRLQQPASALHSQFNQEQHAVLPSQAAFQYYNSHHHHHHLQQEQSMPHFDDEANIFITDSMHASL